MILDKYLISYFRLKNLKSYELMINQKYKINLYESSFLKISKKSTKTPIPQPHLIHSIKTPQTLLKTSSIFISNQNPYKQGVHLSSLNFPSLFSSLFLPPSPITQYLNRPSIIAIFSLNTPFALPSPQPISLPKEIQNIADGTE